MAAAIYEMLDSGEAQFAWAPCRSNFRGIVNGNTRLSLNCNTDIALDLLKARADGWAHFKLVGQVALPRLVQRQFTPDSSQMPFDLVISDHGDGVEADTADAVLGHRVHF